MAEDKVREVLEAAVHCLRSYQYGNGSPDLAKACADKCEAAIAANAPEQIEPSATGHLFAKATRPATAKPVVVTTNSSETMCTADVMHRAGEWETSAPQLEYIGRDKRSHFRVTAGNCVCGQSIVNGFEWEQHLKKEAATPKEFPIGFPLHEVPSALAGEQGTSAPLREQIARAIWNQERNESASKERHSPEYYAEWPKDAERQPYCRSTYRLADAVLAVLATPGAQAKCDYPACANVREQGELYCIVHNRKHTAFPQREGAQAGEWDAQVGDSVYIPATVEKIEYDTARLKLNDGCPIHRSKHELVAAGRAADNGPTCHRCGKLVETGDVLCTEHELEIVNKLVAKRLAAAPGSLSVEQVERASVVANSKAMSSGRYYEIFTAELNALRQRAGAKVVCTMCKGSGIMPGHFNVEQYVDNEAGAPPSERKGA